ncbi:hypothetical protein TARUN_8109 [Trichoderma arundinaceum]|uniref:Uncharacterized protein n=1 Tax=Trichoderma arundinaceum TaxID=490622 RepID=A0A395NEF5_TRIAR|nr:hypothetical protein TARUN_8109 [Trichoderma arundinaceum]
MRSKSTFTLSVVNVVKIEDPSVFKHIFAATRPSRTGVMVNPLYSSPGNGNCDYGWMAKGAALDDMLLLVPEPVSPKTITDRRINDWSKSVVNDKQNISEASLSKGFTFPPREPPRPGRFSNIPRHGQFIRPLEPEPPESCQNLASSPPKDRITDSLVRGSPLDLPELCLPGKVSGGGSIHGHKSDAAAAQKLKLVAEVQVFHIPKQLQLQGLAMSSKLLTEDCQRDEENYEVVVAPKACILTRRKDIAITKLGQYWNECLELNGAETREALWEVQRLQDDIQHHKVKLEKSRALLDQKDIKLCEVETLYKTLLEEDARVLGDNENLNLELKTLRQQLSEEKKRAEAIINKHRSCRSKLNEAIKEQQDLFVRSRTFYQETMDQLRKENACKTSASDAVDKALENSHKKREEMKRCIEEYRIQADKDIKQKDHLISELKEKLNHQEALLAQEKLSTDNLRAQAEEESRAYQCVRALEAKMDSLMAHHTTQNEQRESDAQQSTQMMNMLNLKLDSLIAGGNLVASNMLSREDLELKMSVGEKNIIDKLSPMILSLENGQSGTTCAIAKLEASVRQDLDRLKDEAMQLFGTYEESKEANNTQLQGLQNHICKLGNSLKETENGYEQIGQKVDALVSGEQNGQRTTNGLLQDMMLRLSAHGAKLDDLECRIERAYKGFKDQIESKISEALTDGKETTNLVSSATELRRILEEGFEKERQRAAQLLQGNESIVKVLTSHIDDHKQLAVQTDPKTHELQATLNSEREAAVLLTRKIQALEQKAQESEVLREQWLNDIQIMDTARSQLKTMQERIADVERYDKKLDRILEINKSIQSSASYLAEEKEWVQQELIGRVPEPIVSKVVVSCEIERPPLSLSTEASEGTENRAPAKEDVACRKVTVHSPDPGEKSPSPPPTVIQEQKRRREVTQLRSILKSYATPVTSESSSLEGPSSQPQVNHSKSSHSSNSSIQKAGSASSREVVAEIRSRLLRHDWSFPTVADFERDIQLAGKKRPTPHSDSMPQESEDANFLNPKKLRTEHCAE